MPSEAKHGKRIVLKGGYVFDVTCAHEEWIDKFAQQFESAPELLEALKRVVYVHENTGVHDNDRELAMDDARIVIAKAEWK